MWLPFALATALLWGTGQTFIKKGLFQVTPLVANTITGIITLVVFVPLGLYLGVDFSKVLPSLPFVFLITLMYMGYVYGLDKGQLSLSGTVISSYPLITIALSRLFLQETTSLLQKLAIFLVLGGVVVISLPKDWKQSFKLHSWLVWALMVAVLNGSADFFSKVMIERTDLNTFIFTEGIGYFLVPILIFFIDKKGRVLPPLKFKLLWPIIFGIAFLQIGFLTFNAAFFFGPATLVTTAASAYTAISLFLALTILKEKITFIQFIGVLSIISGIILLGLN